MEWKEYLIGMFGAIVGSVITALGMGSRLKSVEDDCAELKADTNVMLAEIRGDIKKFKVVIMAIMFVVLLTFSVQASDCERYWDELVDQTFETTIGDIDYAMSFGGSVCGPCPSGIATLRYIDTQTINDVEYTSEIELDILYSTSRDMVIIADIEFMLYGGKLIMLPEEPLILNQIVGEDNE